MAQGEGKRGFAPHSLGIIQTGPELGGGVFPLQGLWVIYMVQVEERAERGVPQPAA